MKSIRVIEVTINQKNLFSGVLSSPSYRPEEQGHDLPFRDEEHRRGKSDTSCKKENDVDSLGRTGTT